MDNNNNSFYVPYKGKRSNYRIVCAKLAICNLFIFLTSLIALSIYLIGVHPKDRLITLIDFTNIFVLIPYLSFLFFIYILGMYLYYRNRRKISNRIKLRKHYNSLLQTMSHDIKSPINSIIGLTELSKKSLDDKYKLLECLNKIEVSSNVTLKLINQLLDLTRAKSNGVLISKTHFTLDDLLNEIVAVIYPQAASKNIKFEIVLENTITDFFYTDFLKIYEILVNLLSNGVKYTNENGFVRLKIKEKAIINKLSGFDDSFAVLEFVVEDNGIGMDRETYKNLFTPYKRGKNGMKEEGHGLGMSITKVLTDVLQGNLCIKSQIGVGTIFYLEMPMYLDFSKCSSFFQKDYYKDFKFRHQSVLYLDSYESNNSYIISAFDDLGITVKFNCIADDIVKFAFVFADLNNLSNDKKNLLKVASDNNIPIIIVSNNLTSEINDFNVKNVIFKPATRYAIYKVLNSFNVNEIKTMVYEDKPKSNVLVCDDSAINLDVLSVLLEKNDFNVCKAVNGKEAFEKYMMSLDGYFSHIITDIRMPLLDGYQLAEKIRNSDRNDSDINIICISGDDSVEDLNKAKRAGINKCLSKPVKIEELIKFLNNSERSN